MAFHDLENPMMRAVRECRISGKTFIETYPKAAVHSFTANEASKFVRHQIKHLDDLRKGRFGIFGASSLPVEEAVKVALNASGFGSCQATFATYPHTVYEVPETHHTAMVGPPDGDVRAMIAEAFGNFSRPEKDSPYFSIVVVGRHDNFSKGFEERAQHFLDTIDHHIEKVPLADVEIVFVDYATPIANATLLHNVLKIGKSLKGRVRYVIVPEAAHARVVLRLGKPISFLEYIAKNIGVRRAKGKFVLVTNPDDLLSLQLFELIAARQFNTFVFYRAVRWDNRADTPYTISDLVRGLNEPWEMRKWDVNQRCENFENRFSVITSVGEYHHKSFPCGGGDFMLLSKKMWDAVEGFNEFPANPNVDVVFLGRLMKFVPGYAQLITHPRFLHQRHVKKNIYRPSIENTTDYLDQYACTGRCALCGKFAETEDWGLANEVFQETQQ
jgi:hypothetical protein